MLRAVENDIRDAILTRTAPCTRFFERESLPLAYACREVAERFLRGGRLLAFGQGPYATDAMHVSVEFIHPVIVGKRALPALDISMASDAWIAAICTANDVVIGFGPPEGDQAVRATLRIAKECGAMTVAWPGRDTDYAVTAPSTDAHIHQELFELLGHTMYESTHVFLEHSGLPDPLPANGGTPEVPVTLSPSKGEPPPNSTSFLYPFLEQTEPDADALVDDVASSIRAKARDANDLRERVAREQSGAIAAAASAMRERLHRGGRILAFGNGGSATDATDFALDCIMPANGRPAIPAISLALEPAVITAIANDVGADVIFLRQLIAQCAPNDIAVAFSTSGGSVNVVAALQEARKRGLLTIALLGYDGGEIARRNLADVAIVIPCDYVPRIQEAQGAVYHVLRDALAC